MRDIATQDAGSGSAILSTLQQATLGLGPAVLGGLFLHLLNLTQGNYNEALGGFLVAEIVMMLLLAVAAIGAPAACARCPAN
jgi:hypothetical protein